MSYYLDRFPRHPRAYNHGSTCNGWTIKNSDMADYLKDFYLDRDIDFIDRTVLKLQSEPKPVMIDLLAPEDAIFSFYKTFLSNKPKIKALAVGLEHDYIRPERKDLIRSIGIEVREGDLNKSKTWNEMQEWLGEDKAHLIMERGYGGLHFIPTYIHYYRSAMARLWRMLDPNGGILLLQTPPFGILEKRGVPIKDWLKLLDDEQIFYQYSEAYISQDKGLPYGVLIIEKNPQVEILPDIVNLKKP